jgi:serine/threonine protein kinase
MAPEAHIPQYQLKSQQKKIIENPKVFFSHLKEIAKEKLNPFKHDIVDLMARRRDNSSHVPQADLKHVEMEKGENPFLPDGVRYTYDTTFLEMGGNGAIFQGRDLLMGRPILLKRNALRGDLPFKKEVEKAIEKEAKTIARLNLPHVVKVYDLIHHGNDTFMVMEDLTHEDEYAKEGEDARYFNMQEFIDKKDLNLQQKLEIVEQISTTVDQLYAEGIKHQDLKPANILIKRKQNTVDTKLIDFGTANLVSKKRKGLVDGTAGYISPERLLEEEEDLRSQVFEVAVLTYELLTGDFLFPGEDHQQRAFENALVSITDEKWKKLDDILLQNGTPDQNRSDVKNLLLSSLNKDITQRPTSCTDFVTQLKKAFAL